MRAILVHTVSFSTMGPAPATAADSKVNIELSRCLKTTCQSLYPVNGIGAEIDGVSHVKRSQLRPIGVELVVIILRKLLCSADLAKDRRHKDASTSIV